MSAIWLFTEAMKSFVEQRETNPGQLRLGLVLAGPDAQQPASFPCENVNRQSQHAHNQMIRCSAHNARGKTRAKPGTAQDLEAKDAFFST